MSKAGLDNRHRNHDGEISHKHGNTLIGTLLRRLSMEHRGIEYRIIKASSALFFEVVSRDRGRAAEVGIPVSGLDSYAVGARG